MPTDYQSPFDRHAGMHSRDLSRDPRNLMRRIWDKHQSDLRLLHEKARAAAIGIVTDSIEDTLHRNERSLNNLTPDERQQLITSLADYGREAVKRLQVDIDALFG